MTPCYYRAYQQNPLNVASIKRGIARSARAGLVYLPPFMTAAEDEKRKRVHRRQNCDGRAERNPNLTILEFPNVLHVSTATKSRRRPLSTRVKNKKSQSTRKKPRA